jgi:hypothetical protein
MEFRVSRLEDSSVFTLYLAKDEILLDPTYQRQADIWPLEKKQLLIDSLLNGFDIPKLYFHDFYPGKSTDSSVIRFAIIDGKQRLTAIWDFIDGKFALSDDIELLNQPQTDVAGLTYGELGTEYPRLKATLDSRNLSVTTIQTEDIELIEEMFSRLNEAVPLNAAEKRNALGGPIPPVIRHLAQHAFFTKALPFTNSRYRHFDLACKFLYLMNERKIVDLKKVQLDEFVLNFRGKAQATATRLGHKVEAVLDRLESDFVTKDSLLSQIGMVTLIYLLYAGIGPSTAKRPDLAHARRRLKAFEQARLRNRQVAEQDLAHANFDLLEFDRYAQSPNDVIALRFRYETLREWLAAHPRSGVPAKR